VIHEPKATLGIEGSEAPSPASVEHFQRLMSSWRLDQAMLNSGARILLFDRTFEEDRDVFLRLYYRLGCIDAAQLDRLSRFSIEAEASVGAPDGTIILTAAPEVLRQRLEYAQTKRPQWLVKHIGLQHSLYSEWIAEKRDAVLVLDAATVDSMTLCTMAMKFIATVVVGEGSHDD
jgi:deoxyadenosine/deoxycytidine kinase